MTLDEIVQEFVDCQVKMFVEYQMTAVFRPKICVGGKKDFDCWTCEDKCEHLKELVKKCKEKLKENS